MSPGRLGLVVSAILGLGACAGKADDASTTTLAQSPAGWQSSELARRPDADPIDYETVSLAIDRQGGRHLAFVGEDNHVHYRGPASTETTFSADDAEAVRPRLVLGPDGEPRISFTIDPYAFSGGRVMLATHSGGAWRVEPTGFTGEVDALAVDDGGTVHIATSDVAPAPAYWRAFVTTRRPGAAFVQTEVPRPATSSELSSFTAFGLVVDRAGAEYLLLATAPLEVGTGLGPQTHFARRSAGGAFRVEPVGVDASTGALARDANGTLHAVLSSKGLSGTYPLYIRRGPNDGAWSAPESVALRTSYYSSLAIDARGVVHVAFSTNTADALVYARRSASGSWSSEEVFAGRAQLPSLALDPSGAPVIGYRSGPSYWLAE
ncbi:MAG: hypothetical protein U0270_23500 [Labilithrix sp.]